MKNLTLEEIGKKARRAKEVLRTLSTNEKNEVLRASAEAK